MGGRRATASDLAQRRDCEWRPLYTGSIVPVSNCRLSHPRPVVFQHLSSAPSARAQPRTVCDGDLDPVCRALEEERTSRRSRWYQSRDTHLFGSDLTAAASALLDRSLLSDLGDLSRRIFRTSADTRKDGTVSYVFRIILGVIWKEHASGIDILYVDGM